MTSPKKSTKTKDSTLLEEKNFLIWFRSRINQLSTIFITRAENLRVKDDSKNDTDRKSIIAGELEKIPLRVRERDPGLLSFPLVSSLPFGRPKEPGGTKRFNPTAFFKQELPEMRSQRDSLDRQVIPSSVSMPDPELTNLKFPNELATKLNGDFFLTNETVSSPELGEIRKDLLDETSIKRDRIGIFKNGETPALNVNSFNEISPSSDSNEGIFFKLRNFLFEKNVSNNRLGENRFFYNFKNKQNSFDAKSPKKFRSGFSIDNDFARKISEDKNLREIRPNEQNSRFMDVLSSPKQPTVSITYEEIGLFPRSFNRVFDRFFKQLFFDVENLVIQEYRFYRYLFLTTVKCVFILIFVPFLVNFVCKNYLVKPITEYYWNSAQSEIFLNSYQQRRAFTELKDFEEKIYFESLIVPTSSYFSLNSFDVPKGHLSSFRELEDSISMQNVIVADEKFIASNRPEILLAKSKIAPFGLNLPFRQQSSIDFTAGNSKNFPKNVPLSHLVFEKESEPKSNFRLFDQAYRDFFPEKIQHTSSANSNLVLGAAQIKKDEIKFPRYEYFDRSMEKISDVSDIFNSFGLANFNPETYLIEKSENSSIFSKRDFNDHLVRNVDSKEKNIMLANNSFSRFNQPLDQSIQRLLQQKTLELAIHYNEESIESITNFFADLISFSTLCFLLFNLEIQINITKSFLLEVFFGLDDSKKSLLILFVTDLLVGYHSPNIWELFFQSLFDHYGLPESQTTIFLLVATLPVLLDVLFKYLIFRHLNRASPATVATYHAMIE